MIMLRFASQKSCTSSSPYRRLLSYSLRKHQNSKPPDDQNSEIKLNDAIINQNQQEKDQELAFQQKREKFIEHWSDELEKLEAKFDKPKKSWQRYPKGVTRFDELRRPMLNQLVENAKNPPVYEPLNDPQGLDQKYNIFGRDYQAEIEEFKAKPRIGARDEKGQFHWNWEHRIKQMDYQMYLSGIAFFMLSVAVMSVPMYKIFCASVGQGHSINDLKQQQEQLEGLQVDTSRKLRIHFGSQKTVTMDWNFHADQRYVDVYPGETALVFYKAKNPTNEPVIGVSTYHINPLEAAGYFNKIQCFCFEQQMLGPNEEVELPVFFYIDPEIVEDYACQGTNDIYLTYTFFKCAKDFDIPLPGFTKYEEEDALAAAT